VECDRFQAAISHYFSTQASPPNVNQNICVAAGSPLVGGSSLRHPELRSVEPPLITFDLSVG
jgi:hypothetical protein